MNTAVTSRDIAQALWQGWVELWNGDLSQADRILAADFTTHAALVGVDGDAAQGAAGLAGWVAMLRQVLGEPVFTVEVGPVIDGDIVVGRWHVQGRYAGGFPGATAAPGSPVDFTGTDILRIADGHLTEYWINSDVHVMAAQLGLTG